MAEEDFILKDFTPAINRDILAAMKQIGKAMAALYRIERALPPDERVTTREPQDQARISMCRTALGGASNSLIEFSMGKWPRGQWIDNPSYYEDEEDSIPETIVKNP